MGASLLAVHISDGVLATPWIAAGFAGAAALLAAAWPRLSEAEVPRIGVLTAAFFVASSVHVKLPPASAHLVLNGLLGVVLGRRAPIAVAVGLVLQYFLVSHGGLSTLGVNTCVIALPAVAAGLLFPLLRRVGVPAFPLGFALGAGAVAASAGLEFVVLLFGGKEDWQTLAKLVLLAHVPVMLVEGLVLGVVVSYLEKVKPSMLRIAAVGGGERPAAG